MATTPDTSSSDLDLDSLIQSLPACRRCRDCRRGCDTLLPSCRQCTKANAECVFYDHGRKEFLPRSYIAKLVEDVQKLSAIVKTPNAAITPATVASSSSSSSTAEAPPVSEDGHLHRHHFAYAVGSYRYLGANSCLVTSGRLQRREVSVPVIPQSDEWEQVVESSTKVEDLVRTYLDVVQPLYPVLDDGLPILITHPHDDMSSAELFALNMVCSIACYVMPDTKRRNDPRWQWQDSGKLDFHHFASEKYRHLAQSFFVQAMEHLEASTTERNIVTLRSVLLLTINSLFEPKNGNLGQQIALASRLALSLESQLKALDPQDRSPEDIRVLHNMHLTIFSIENDVATTLDRPAYFPEPESELSFDVSNPSEYLCSLYRVQHRFRKGDRSVLALLPSFDSHGRLNHHPWLRMILHQTHLLKDPVWQCAYLLLEAVVSQGCFHISLTPHWVYRAGCVLLENINEVYVENLVQLYSNAVVILDLSRVKWPNTTLLKDSLEDLLNIMKAKTYWGHKQQKHYDLTL